MDPADNVRQWLLTHQVATLGTTLCRGELEGYPYASVVPFALDGTGRPLILIANIATHTANLRADPRGALLVREPGLEGDPQRGWRISVMGDWACVPSEAPDHAELLARYRERVPAADQYLATHGFDIWRMQNVRKVRYIGGFGKITWVDGADCLREPDGEGLAAAAPGAIAHMNEDHRHNLLEMVKGRYGVEPADVEMVGVDRAGMLVRTQAPDGLFHFSFTEEIDAAGLRKAVVAALQRTRSP